MHVSYRVSDLKSFIKFSHFVAFTTPITSPSSINDGFLLKSLFPDHITALVLLMRIIKIFLIEYVEIFPSFCLHREVKGHVGYRQHLFLRTPYYHTKKKITRLRRWVIVFVGLVYKSVTLLADCEIKRRKLPLKG